MPLRRAPHMKRMRRILVGPAVTDCIGATKLPKEGGCAMSARRLVHELLFENMSCHYDGTEGRERVCVGLVVASTGSSHPSRYRGKQNET
jgi:hypothetical protein